VVESEALPPVIIPYQKLSAEALRGVIEEFVTRDGSATPPALRRWWKAGSAATRAVHPRAASTGGSRRGAIRL